MVPGVKPETSLALLKQSIFEIVEYAAGKDVRVGMEYEPGLIVERAEELAVLIREAGAENFGANLDFGHSHLAGEAPSDVAKRLSSRIFHIHLEGYQRPESIIISFPERGTSTSKIFSGRLPASNMKGS